MKIAIPKETRDKEPRVAATPETVKKFIGLGAEVTVEKGAGAGSYIADALFEEAGAKIAGTHKTCVSGADVVLKVRRPQEKELKDYKSGTVVACLLNPYNDPDTMKACADAGLTVFAMEFIPRITRAQSMDVLSSQANLAGYRAVVEAAALFEKAMPMMMTAAGTVAPAKAFVMGAGVAGLQAIATARRLGAVVTATDVRPAAKEQVESLGAKFIAVEDEEFKQAETAGGYAKEMSEEYRKKQAELVASHVAKQDMVITTALIPGRPAPVLVTEEMVKAMRPGSVIVDLAVEQGGNCPLSKPDEVVEAHGVRIVGYPNMAGRIAVDASALYARNLLNFLTPMIDKEKGALAIDWDDDIVKGTLIARDGAVVHPNFAKSG
ncbi:Re/Si-specific NAD(P)(+) transhydrogenase subunit alpha [Futiania mangrovi]|uniref:NAD(P) transhydrogenase subunit alpha part 1 n=1 Tax=Futiania mangrovi TaxID=2959716 RepID=A0A9J6PFG3_9PROT|nr:Re/Si-specific NAD(P)(+) transhydrogenase subunit alpha [Futiania mangrovii]MCP1334850.1 Re/Si-specific NAD(P)(+) transhydrogenase subunit alpha [Futiania mangrovii]